MQEHLASIQADAQLNALHLAAAVVKLLPDWLPDSLFQVLYQRWKSEGRKKRCAPLLFRLMGFALLMPVLWSQSRPSNLLMIRYIPFLPWT